MNLQGCGRVALLFISSQNEEQLRIKLTYTTCWFNSFLWKTIDSVKFRLLGWIILQVYVFTVLNIQRFILVQLNICSTVINPTYMHICDVGKYHKFYLQNVLSLPYNVTKERNFHHNVQDSCSVIWLIDDQDQTKLPTLILC